MCLGRSLRELALGRNMIGNPSADLPAGDPDDGEPFDGIGDTAEGLPDGPSSDPADGLRVDAPDDPELCGSPSRTPPLSARRRPPRIRRVMSARTRNVISWAWVLLTSLTLALLMRTFLVAAFSIPSVSMEPVLEVGDRLLVSKLSYRIGDPSPGDIVVFRAPRAMSEPQTDELIKRVVAVGGELVEAIGSQLYVDGRALDEPYLPEGTYTRDFGPILVPREHVFVMGDNRASSQDSRYFGAVAESEIVGRAFVRFWPLARLGGL